MSLPTDNLTPSRRRTRCIPLLAAAALAFPVCVPPIVARDLAQIADEERTMRRLGDDSKEAATRDESTGITFTITAAAGARYKSNVYETRRDRIASAYFDPEALLFARKPLDFDPRLRIGLGVYANQQIHTHRAARDAGYSLLRGIVEADFQDQGWRVALRYAPGVTLEPDRDLVDYTAHDFRLRTGYAIDAGQLIGAAPDALIITPQITLLRREASRASKTKAEAVGSLIWDYRFATAWIFEGEVSATFTRYERIAGFRERDVAIRLEPRITYAPIGSNYALGAMLGLGRRFSNVSDFDAFYWESGPGAEAKATLRVRF